MPADPGSHPRPARGWLLLFWLACGAALALRLVRLDVRPLHHDEAVNAWFLRDLLEGRGYRYNPQAFHGPFLVLFSWLPARLCGVGTIALRLPVALVSAALVPLLLPLRRRLGTAGVAGAAWLLAVSPSLVFYGRDLIHETYLAFFTLALVAAASLWEETGRRRHLLPAAAALALLFTAKETAVLTLAGLAVAAGVVGVWEWQRTKKTARTQGTQRARLRGSDLGLAAAVFAVIYGLFFTTMLSHPAGLVDSFRAFLPWVQKGVQGSGHEKPWTYFPELLLAFEPVALACAAGGAAVSIRCRDRFGLFCALWTAGQLALYSAIPYKTPWLMINMVVPAALAGGVLWRAVAALRPSWRRPAFAVLALALGWSAWRAADVSLRRYDDPALGLVYSDTSRDVWNLLAFVRAAAARAPDPGHPSIAVFLEGRWPLPWYLRDIPGIRWEREVQALPRADIVLSESRQEERLRPLLAASRGGYRRREYVLRSGVPVGVWVRGALWPAEAER